MKLFFFDTETTGVNPREDVIIQFGWIFWEFDPVLNVWEEKERINQYINTDKHIPYQATCIHWITNDMLVEYEYIDYYIDQFLSYLKKADYIIGHNISFDANMLYYECKRLWISVDFFENLNFLDTMRPTSELVNGRWWRWPKLKDLYRFLFWYDFENAHDAMADIEATRQCFLELVKNTNIYDKDIPEKCMNNDIDISNETEFEDDLYDWVMDEETCYYD